MDQSYFSWILWVTLLMLNASLASSEFIIGNKLRSLQLVSPLDSLAYSSYTSIQIFNLLNWKVNNEIINNINSDHSSTFTAAHNQFSYLSLNQIIQQYLTVQANGLPNINVQLAQKPFSPTYSSAGQTNQLTNQPQTTIPSNTASYNYDWRTSLSSPVKNQGFCGACWAFAATADLQSTYMLKYQYQIDFSEQQLIDCSSSYGNQGCGGGMMNNAYQYVIKFGIALESYYPFQKTASNCKYDPTTMPHFSISKSNIIYGSCSALAQILTQRPVSVVISANIAFIFYQSGILNSCGTTINHALQLVGMVKNEANGYYIGKNSWGNSWGMLGYVYIDSQQEGGNLCNVCAYPQYPS